MAITRDGRDAGQGERSGGLAPWLLCLAVLLAPAAGVHGEEMLQDTLKSAIVAFCALAAALAFFVDQRRHREPLRWHTVLWVPVLLLAHALGSMAWSHPYLAGVEAVRWFLFALMAWLALNTCTRERLPWLAWCAHGGAVIASVWAAWQFWGGLDLFPQGPQPASTFVNRNFFAEFTVCALPFGALLLARARTPWQVGGLSASLGFVLTALLMTGTRSALVAAALLVVVLGLAAWRCRKQLALAQWNTSLRLLAVAGLAGTVLVLGNVPTGNADIAGEGYGLTPITRGLHRAQSITPGDHSLNVRMGMWRATLRAIAAHPLAGLGAGAWENEIPRYEASGSQIETDYYVHDEFLQLVAEDGVVGWIALLALAAWLVGAARRTWRAQGELADADRPWRAVLLASLLALLVVSSIGFPWRLASTGALFALCMGALAASDARLATASRSWLRAIPWSPLASKLALAATTACLVLAVHITQQAQAAERDLVRAARLALAISRSGDPNDPRFAGARRQVLQLVRAGIAINPHYRKITPMVADEFARWGDWADAVWIWESVLASRPNVVVILTNVARGYDTLGRREQAMVALARARAIQPRAPAVRSLEVLMLARAGQEPAALAKAQASLAEGIADYDLVNTAFILAARAGAYAEARELLERRMRDWPESRARGLVQMGRLYDEGFHDPDRALAAFDAGLASASERERHALLASIPARYRTQLAPAAPAQTSASKR
ncbi:O-antigen ligase family protein [Ramlibacter ginsenosidimutans]|uniref:O-antigen ligase family protein n=1 Tax=Ramlibacter ginsenosidimutans TaxID=502333 RepID=A0A934WNN9_9BURK|nr:O-antigen ligase family protein [Ramlibacter ginsenosidimutans]